LRNGGHMKLCDKIEKIIILSDLNSLSIKEKKAIFGHIEQCEPCKLKVQEVGNYQRFILTLRNTSPELNNPVDLTNSIMNSIDKLRVGNNSKLKKLWAEIHYFSYKIAAGILLFVLIGFYLQQKIYVNKHIISLEISYASKNKNKPLINNYNNCLEFSERFIKQQMASDGKFSDLILEHFRKNPFKVYSNYASTICLQSHAQFSTADNNTKKKIIIEFLCGDINQNQNQ